MRLFVHGWVTHRLYGMRLRRSLLSLCAATKISPAMRVQGVENQVVVNIIE